ncbi:unnamed protein product [Peronospora destructor]|uniref:DNA topoisomerase (ATP-hydrolyzing) n=1 Tax=Peronospora destructor TaxID=86335 RepID=A0AAV0V1M3_9STRA|nr:unnamed protein product [Peronospora destructor]
MHAFNANGQLVKYETSEDILRDFYVVRRDLYSKRKHYLEQHHMKDVLRLSNRIRFIKEVSSGSLQKVIKERMPKHELVELLKQHGFSPASAFKMKEIDHVGDLGLTAVGRIDDDAIVASDESQDFDYLLNTSFMSLTKEVSDRLQKEHKMKQTKLQQLQIMTPAQIWRDELFRLRTVLLRDIEFQGIQRRDQVRSCRLTTLNTAVSGNVASSYTLSLYTEVSSLSAEPL